MGLDAWEGCSGTARVPFHPDAVRENRKEE